ncbi:structural maintenance of chromosomes protein 2-like isoform X1 [Hydra vulgaris]|uniref:Structural maintenance of chromosomes protein 2-like isoform X1 n=1 Tax=Hydra vulgaris TaxID=6087 RepID=A0ABM4CDA5_HYDVU
MLKKENKILKRKMESMMDLQMDYFTHLKDFEDMSNNLKILISKNSLIEAELNFIKKCYCEKEDKLNNIENKLELLKSKKESFNVRNLNKKIKYRDTQLEIKKNKINLLKNEEKKIILQLKNKITDINSILQNSDINISELKNEKIKLQKKVSNLKVILQNKTNYINDNNMKDVISLEKEVVSLYSKTNILKEENLELQKLVSLLDDDEVITFEDGRYSDDIRETIMKLLSMNVSMNSVNEVIKVVLILKWGFDGSSGHSEYKQRFADGRNSDANVFLTSLVPLQLLCTNSVLGQDIILWKNRTPSSTRFCRPIRLQFLHENVHTSINEKDYIEDKIAGSSHHCST